MSDGPLYTAYHPRWFRPHISTYWWLKRRAYFAFILRELSSIFIAWFVVYLLLLVRAVSLGDSNYQAFLEWSRHPVVMTLNVVTLLSRYTCASSLSGTRAASSSECSP